MRARLTKPQIAAYSAGFFDGPGYVGIEYCKSRNSS
jgi:hypothetical protein